MIRHRAPKPVMTALRWPLRWTWLGLCAESLLRAFWPLVSFVLLIAGLGMFGAGRMVSDEKLTVVIALLVVVALVLLIWGVRKLRIPSRYDALARLDETLAGRPLAALTDMQAIGANDAASQLVWRTHLARMAIVARQAKAPRPEFRLADRDPFALRLIALLVFSVAVFFGSFGNLKHIPIAAVSGPSGPIVTGAQWEGWIQPPRYTGLPNLYLNDLIGMQELEVAQGSLIQIRLYDQGGAKLTHSLDDSGLDGAEENSDFVVSRSGELQISGDTGANWAITMLPDHAPILILPEVAESTLDGEFVQLFHGIDDFGILRGDVEIELDLAAVDRRYGRVAEPDEYGAEKYDLPLPLTKSRDDFEEVFSEDFAAHRWAGLPVRMAYSVEDGLGQLGQEFVAIHLPKRKFFNPLAGAVAELRRDLLWARDNGPMVAQILRAVSYLPEEMDVDSSGFLMLKAAITQLETAVEHGLTTQEQTEITDALWEVALRLEDGGLEDAKARLERAEQRLSEAMERGAGPEEISELMQELRDAMDDYIRELAENAERSQDRQTAENQEGAEVTQDEIDALMEQIEALMEEGRMEEAQQLLAMLLEMMENMQIAQGSGEGAGQSPSEQAMDALEETLREQQQLSDEAFRQLQESYNPSSPNGQQSGQSQGQSGTMGQSGEGQDGTEQRRGAQGMGQGEGEGEGDGLGQGEMGEGQSLEGRQRALTEGLREQQDGGEGASGDTASDAMRRAERAMDEAGDALGNSDIPGALDRQAEAIEALREGLREMAEVNRQGGNGEQEGESGRSAQSEGRNAGDPLGRKPGSRGGVASDGEFANDPEAYRRARELMDEIQRRFEDQNRPQIERDYLERLLDEF